MRFDVGLYSVKLQRLVIAEGVQASEFDQQPCRSDGSAAHCDRRDLRITGNLTVSTEPPQLGDCLVEVP